MYSNINTIPIYVTGLVSLLHDTRVGKGMVLISSSKSSSYRGVELVPSSLPLPLKFILTPNARESRSI